MLQSRELREASCVDNGNTTRTAVIQALLDQEQSAGR
jgi:hypothetical protein